MKKRKSEPPFVLDSARVIKYAILDRSVVQTGHSMMVVGGKVLGAVPRLAVCENLSLDKDYLLFYCNRRWRVLGAAGFKTLKLALKNAEKEYSGVSGKWQTLRKLSAREIAYVKKVRAFVRNPKPKEDYPEPPRKRG